MSVRHHEQFLVVGKTLHFIHPSTSDSCDVWVLAQRGHGLAQKGGIDHFTILVNNKDKFSACRFDALVKCLGQTFVCSMRENLDVWIFSHGILHNF